jgi:ABC-type nitrate/sulfonate/bicarbonate transport system substrate-binding protein
VKHARLLVLAIALLVAAVAAACGGSSNDSSSSATSTDAAATPTKVRLVYFWPSIDFLSVPIVVAQQKGYFKDANLDVSLSLPPDSATATKVLGTGDADLGMVTTTDIAAAAQEDVPVMSIGNYTMSNNWGFFSKPGTPVSASTLKGKTISGFGDTWTNAMLPFVLEDAGLTESDVKIVTVTNDAPLLLNGKVDLATNTTNYLIPAVEDATGETPGLLLATDAGAPNVPIWVYAGNHDWLVENPEAAKAFMGAIAQATEWAIANPDALRAGLPRQRWLEHVQPRWLDRYGEVHEERRRQTVRRDRSTVDRAGQCARQHRPAPRRPDALDVLHQRVPAGGLEHPAHPRERARRGSIQRRFSRRRSLLHPLPRTASSRATPESRNAARPSDAAAVHALAKCQTCTAAFRSSCSPSRSSPPAAVQNSAMRRSAVPRRSRRPRHRREPSRCWSAR